MKQLQARSILVFVLLIVAATAAFFTLRGLRSGARLPSVILISIDTCRADILSCYGHPGGTTPRIDAVARDGVLFKNVISPMPLTLPAHCSMLTGTIPPSHGVHDNINYRLGDSSVTLSERLEPLGYRTAGFISAVVLGSETAVNQGFELYDDRFVPDVAGAGLQPERRGGKVTALASAWLDRNASEPFFLFLHYYDPHFPYVPPEPFASNFAGDPYAGEVAYADQCVGQVIDKLKRLALYDSSLIVIAGDHGEGLGDHGEQEHGYFIYHSTTKVPLIVKPPGRRAPATVETLVSLTDIVPTVLALLRQPVPLDVQGVDLSPCFAKDGPGRNERFLYSESMTATRYGCSSLLGLETHEWKYIQAPRPELYHFPEDPGESRNVLKDHPDRARAMQARLASLLAEHKQTGSEETALALDSESLDRLRALGYTGGSVEENFEFDVDQEDPKDLIDVHNKIEAMDYALKSRDRATARRLGEELLAQRPDLTQVHRRLGRLAIEEDEPDAAITHFSEALRLAPDSSGAAAWHNNLGNLLARKERLQEAIRHYDAALRLVRNQSGQPTGGGRAQAVTKGTASLMFSIHLNRGSVLAGLGRYAEAVDELIEAVRLNPRHPAAHYHLGLALAELGQINEAAEAFRTALRLDPRFAPARTALESLTNGTGRTSRP